MPAFFMAATLAEGGGETVEDRDRAVGSPAAEDDSVAVTVGAVDFVSAGDHDLDDNVSLPGFLLGVHGVERISVVGVGTPEVKS